MAIDAYVGLPGHGKSYGVVQHVVIPSLKQGRHVVTNIPLQVDMLMEDFPDGQITQLPADWFEREDLASLFPNGSVAVLDELWRRWPQAMTSKQAPMADKSLLAEHRHMVDSKGNSMRIVFITQDLSQLASFARVLVEQTFRVEKLVELGLRNRYRVDIYRGPVTGQSPPKSSFIRSSGPHKYKEEVYRYYKSATKSDTGEVGDESKSDNRGSIWYSPKLWAALAMGVCGPLVGGYYVLDFFDTSRFQEAAPAKQVIVNPPPPSLQGEMLPPAAASSAPAVAAEQKPSGPVVSDFWRVGGFLMPAADSRPNQPGWASKVGYGSLPDDPPISKTARVVLTSPAGTRFVPLEKCQLQDDIYVTCPVDGQLVTFWSGAMTGVTGAIKSGVQRTVEDGVAPYERSDVGAQPTETDSHRPAAQATASPGVDPSRAAHTL
ncbi:hypothetical protein LJR232_003136 [Aquipseudomonas alcaligenes]